MSSRWIAALLLIGWVAGPSLAWAAPSTQTDPAQSTESVKPGINAPYLDPELDIDEWIGRFEVESREVYRHRKPILEAIGLKRGDRVADIGSGTGLFVEPFSEAVGVEGWVFALDIAPRFVERVGAIAELKHLRNVTPVLTGQDELRIPPRSVDVAFVCHVYHHFEFPAATLASIREALKPGGTFVVVDFERKPGDSRPWILDHVRAGKGVVRKEIETSGFRFVEEVGIPGLSESYFLRFRKPGCQKPGCRKLGCQKP